MLGAEGPGWGRPLRAPSLASVLKMEGAGGGTTCRMDSSWLRAQWFPWCPRVLSICPAAGDDPHLPLGTQGQRGLVCHEGQPPCPPSLRFQIGLEQVQEPSRSPKPFWGQLGRTCWKPWSEGRPVIPILARLWDKREGCKQAEGMHQRCLPFGPCF